MATKHLRCSDRTHGGTRATGNIAINVQGDVGRNVDLNDAGGGGHGNHQNLYTLSV